MVTTAEGNPFYTEELVKWLVEQGLIRTGDHWHVEQARLEGLRVPPTLKGVLQARLDALSPVERDAVQRASVVGRVFWDGAVSAAADLSPETTHGGARRPAQPARSSIAASSRASSAPRSACSSTRWSATSPTRACCGHGDSVTTPASPGGWRTPPSAAGVPASTPA